MWQNSLVVDSHGILRVSELNQYRGKRSFKSVDRNQHVTTKMHEIKLSNGMVIKLVPSNYIGVMNSRGEFIARKATDVQPGDIVIHAHDCVREEEYPLYFSDVYTKITPEIAYIIGLMLRGTSSFVSSYNLIKIFTNGADHHLFTDKIEDILGYDIGEKISRSRYVEVIPSERFAEFIRCSHILTVNERDGIPICIRRGTTTAMSEFLAGYLYANGYEISTETTCSFGNNNLPFLMCRDIVTCSLVSPLWMESVEVNKEPYYRKEKSNIIGKYSCSNENLNQFYGPRYKNEDDAILENIPCEPIVKNDIRFSSVLSNKEITIPSTKFEKAYENYKKPVILDGVYVDAIYRATRQGKKGKK